MYFDAGGNAQDNGILAHRSANVSRSSVPAREQNQVQAHIEHTPGNLHRISGRGDIPRSFAQYGRFETGFRSGFLAHSADSGVQGEGVPASKHFPQTNGSAFPGQRNGASFQRQRQRAAIGALQSDTPAHAGYGIHDQAHANHPRLSSPYLGSK
jgi:hypothetical protein